jgi:hypothetical protein
MNPTEVEQRLVAIRAKDRHREGRKPCAVCGQHALITQVHHLVPIKTMRLLLNLASSYNSAARFNYKTVSLCPNHHALLHMAADRKILPVDIDPGEEKALLELVEIQASYELKALKEVSAQVKAVNPSFSIEARPIPN